jgi:hypothetical protein
VGDLAVVSAALGCSNVPTASGSGNHSLANLGSGLAKRSVASPDGAAPASAIGIVGLNDGDPREIDLGFFGEDHGQGSEDSLAHLRFV